MALSAAMPANEQERLARLHALKVLDTEAEPLFDALTGAAALVVGAPIALVTLVDADRQWFKSNQGLTGVAETPRDVAFCAHTILEDSVLEVADACADARFADNPLVTGAPGIRFYVGAPIILKDGLRMGALCVIDRTPRTLTQDQREILSRLARAAAEALDQRLLATERAAALQREAEAGARLGQIIEATRAGTCEWNLDTGEVHCNQRWAEIGGRTLAEMSPTSDAAQSPWLKDVHPEDRPRVAALLDGHLRGETPVYDVETRVRHREGHSVWVRDRGRALERSDADRPRWMYGTRIDISLGKHVELALAASEARTRALYEATPAMLHSVDMQGCLLAVSDLWLQRLDYDRTEVIGRPWSDFLAPASREHSPMALPDFLRTGRCDRVACQMLSKGGEIFDIELSARLEHDDGGFPVRSVAVIEDVTARLQAERRLLASEAFLDRTGKLAGVGGWEVDLAMNEITWSDETCRLHDLPPGHHPTMEEAIGYYAPEARDKIEAAVAKAIADGLGWDLELPLIAASGRPFWGRAVGSVIFEDGHPRKLVGAFQDITFRRQASDSLEASERRFRKLFQYSMGLICTHDLDGVLLSINPSAARSLGYSAGDLLGRRLDEFMDPKFHEIFHAYLARIASEGSDSGTLRLIDHDGNELIWQYHNVLDQEGDAPYVLGHAQDVTRRQLHLEQLRDRSMRDPLTGCFNRRFLQELESIGGERQSWGCIAIDLDRFKHINDTYGHQRGDEVLIAMGRYLHEHIRPDDAVVRAGGDEFIVLLKGADEHATKRVVQRMLDDLDSAPNAYTLGYAIRDGDESIEEVLALADKRLYEVRAAVRDDGADER